MHQLTTTTWLCVLALMVTSPYCHAGSVLSFKATPSVIKTDLTRQVMMRCEVAAQSSKSASTDQDVARLTQYVVTLANGSVVAEVNSDHAMGFIDEGNLRVAGSVSGTGYIQLTWARPSEMSITTYKCQVHARSKTNTFVQLKASLTLSSEVPTIADLVTHINEIEQEYKEADKNQNQLIKDLTAENRAQQQTITDLQQCTAPRVAFMAVMSFTGSKTLSGDQRVIYDKVLTNTDGGFDSKTSEFTVTTPGVYEFSFGGLGASGYVELDLTINSVKITSTAFNTGSTYESGFASAVVVLKKGDLVHIETDANFSSTHKLVQSTSYARQPNSFSGVLLHSDACLP